MTYRLPLYAKEEVTHSLPDSDNVRQQSINDFWSCIVGNLIGEWLQTPIDRELAAFIGR